MKDEWLKKYSREIFIGIFLLVVIIWALVAHNQNTNQSSLNTNSPNVSNTSSTNNNSSSQPSTNQTQSQTSTNSAPSCFTAAQSWNEIGQTGCVTFTGYAYTSSSGQMYLDQDPNNYSNGFSVWIPAGESFGPSILNQYSGVQINVSGSITQYDGAPEIIVTDASQIQLAQ